MYLYHPWHTTPVFNTYHCTGVPLPPMPSASVTHATTIQLMWPVPFTHQGYGVDHYTVTVRNTATDNVFAANVSGTSYTYTRIGGVAQECEELMITVTASNTVGESSGATINAGFPIGMYNSCCTIFFLSVWWLYRMQPHVCMVPAAFL